MSDFPIHVEISVFAVTDDGLVFSEEVQTGEGSKKSDLLSMSEKMLAFASIFLPSFKGNHLVLKREVRDDFNSE